MEVSIFNVHAQVVSCTYIQLLATLNFVFYLVSFLIDGYYYYFSVSLTVRFRVSIKQTKCIYLVSHTYKQSLYERRKKIPRIRAEKKRGPVHVETFVSTQLRPTSCYEINNICSSYEWTPSTVLFKQPLSHAASPLSDTKYLLSINRLLAV